MSKYQVSGILRLANYCTLAGKSAGVANTTSSGGLVAVGIEAASIVNLNSQSSVYIGYRAGKSAQGSIASDVVIGYNAMSATAGAYNANTLIGDSAGMNVGSMSATHNNVLIGYSAGKTLTASTSCTMVGAYAGEFSTTSSSTMAGCAAGRHAATAICMGYMAGDKMQTTSNIACGYQCAYNYSSLSATPFCTFVGYQAGYGDAAGFTGVENVAVGHYSGMAQKAAVNHNTLVGSLSGTAITTGGGNTCVGFMSGTGLTTGTSNVFVGSMAGWQRTIDVGSVAVGASAGAGASASNVPFTAVGFRALGSITTGPNNVAVGYNALASLTTSARNTAMGFNAGASLTTGTGENVFLGNQAGQYHTASVKVICIGNNAARGVDGVTNVDSGIFIGSDAGSNITTGTNNVCVGNNSALSLQSGSYNVIIGHDCAVNIASSSGNVLIGDNLGDAYMTGDYNVMIGMNAGATFDAGTDNVCIGNGSDISPGVSNSTAIGPNAVATVSNVCVLGNGHALIDTVFGHVFHMETTQLDDSPAGTLTAAAMSGGIVMSNPAGATTITLDSAANIAATCFLGIPFGSLGCSVGSTVQFQWINSSAFAIAVAVPADVTNGASTSLPANDSRTCSLRCTGSGTFTLYV
jgi:hypothetical protein